MIGALLLVGLAYMLWQWSQQQQAAASTGAPYVDPASAWQPPAPIASAPAGTLSPQAALDIVHALNAQEFGGWFDPRDVMAVIAVESAFDPSAIGGAGERGLMQVLPSTARDRGIDPEALFDPVEGIRAGMRQLKWTWDYLVPRLGSPTELQWFGAYNAGVGNILRGYQNVAYMARIDTARANMSFT